jgi:hypothetical protein
MFDQANKKTQQHHNFSLIPNSSFTDETDDRGSRANDNS